MFHNVGVSLGQVTSKIANSYKQKFIVDLPHSILQFNCFSNLTHDMVMIQDGNISWTMISSGPFFSKWANFRAHLRRVTSRGHFLVNSSEHFCPQEVKFLGEFLWTLFDVDNK